MANTESVGGIPIECLTGQLAGIWSGWTGLGDREIVREASAKGTHIELACKFLKTRRNCSLQEAKAYFSNEVEIWVNALLRKKQIHRASHILNNIGKIPMDYIHAICLKCKEPELRSYLAKHVESCFNVEEKEAWDIVNLFVTYEEKFNLQSNLISHKCLEEIINLPQSIKDALYTELYFYHYEPNIVAYLKSEVVWDYLLANNQIELIKFWIDKNFNNSDNLTINISEHRSDIQLLLANLKITDSMISSIDMSNGMLLVKNLILNYLSRYGIFTTKESSDMKLILARLFGDCITASNFQQILSKEFCNIDKNSFFAKLDTLGFSRNYQESSNIHQLDERTKKLFDSIKDLCNAKSNYKESLERGIVETIHYLSSDINQFLKHSFIISFTLIFLHYSTCKQSSNQVTLREMFIVDSELKTNTLSLTKDILETVIFHLPLLKNEIDSKMPKNHISMYELLDGYQKFNSTSFFKWRIKNEIIPSFLNDDLVKKYGHKEKLSYINYLKEARPNMAANILRFEQEKIADGISSKAKSQASLCAHVFALRHSKNSEIVSGCISFLEIVGVSSEGLRLHITAARIIRQELNVSIESSLESIIFNNQQELKMVLNYLERSFHRRLTAKMIDDNEEFIQAICAWDIIVKFARTHNTMLPISLLKFLATNDAWFEFALVGHIFSYPVNQITECVQHFSSPSLKEHLLLSLNNPHILRHSSFIENKKPNSERNKEKYRRTSSRDLELKLDVNQPIQVEISNKVEPVPKHTDTTESMSAIFDTSMFVDDLWLIILKCHQSQDPPGSLLKASRIFKSPILTVLATCYEPSSTSSYCYSWLVITVENARFVKDYEKYLESQIWTASTVLNLFHHMVSNGFVNTLYQGMQIFIPENPLKLFVEFLVQYIDCGNFNDCQQHLTDFITVCSNYKCNKLINWECSDATYLENVYWIQTVVVKCIIVVLGNALNSTSARIKLLEVLIKSDFHKKLIVDTPNFEALLEYIKILSKTPVNLNYFCFDTTVKIHESEAEIEKCVNELINLEDYTNALCLSKVANLKASKVILAQYRSEFKRNADKDGMVDCRFWSRCASDFKKNEVCYEKAAEFFVEHAEKVKSFKDRYEILKLALEILEQHSRERQLCDKVEMAMWKSCILAGPKNIEIKSQDSVYKKLKTELLSSISGLQVICSLEEPDEKVAVEVLIGRLLDAGRLDTALRICAIFNYRNKELQILMLCLSLAEGEISPYQLSTQQRILVSELKPRQRNNTLRSKGVQHLPSSSSLNLSPLSINSSNTSEAENATMILEQQEQWDRLSLLTTLIENLEHGIDIGVRVLLCYRLAVQLGKTYQALLTLSKPVQLLQEVISSPNDRKLEIARDIITAYQITNQRIAHFLAEEIVAHITQVIEDGLNEPTAAGNYNMHLQSVIELCKDTSLLGLKLLDMAHKLLGHSYGEKRNLVTLKIIVELLIRSHDCFTASCNMEGIASVLRKCQQLANSLQNLKHWSLLVRLVTGVGRFTEMNYIFQILKEHDQFEFLLGKGLDKVPGLRMALLDFLKRHCSENKDLFNIVALHFQLYYEIALVWENEAKEVINELIIEAKKECIKNLSNPQAEIKLTRNESTEKRLQLVIANLTHATQYFLQDNKLNLANRCSHQAQLVALQISLLTSASQNQQFPSILNLNSDEINKAICRHLSFSQALILARAYDHHVDWASAIYSHCLLKGEAKYLKDFITSKRLTASVAIDCAKRYKLEKNINRNMTENMQFLVAKLNDNECKYVLASQLGFRNIIEEMLNDPAIGAYLKDTVFRKRYVTSEFVGESFLAKG
ncbi:spatacsin [Phymastichus coffea]|uniref:spatacsin n=1 Tax=Phymastichus coffea TaxID=108790 RepID=UPI00273C4CD3|nr:spatacsin [Phymastichus coffea]